MTESVSEEFIITEEARERIEFNIEKRGKGIGVRVGVKTTGCSGMAYTMEFVDEPRKEDHVYPINDVLSVYVDPKAFQYLRGSTMDYVKQGLNEGFEFINPNEKGRCGCGESFTV
jgi:iron-sulfur cluster assembly protein